MGGRGFTPNTLPLSTAPIHVIIIDQIFRVFSQVAQLSSIERRVASWLFGEVPTGTVENAIAGFLKTEELIPYEWKENKLLLAKCYVQLKDYKKALEWLDKALNVPPRNSQVQ